VWGSRECARFEDVGSLQDALLLHRHAARIHEKRESREKSDARTKPSNAKPKPYTQQNPKPLALGGAKRREQSKGQGKGDRKGEEKGFRV
jgi:hypothetical protein